MRLHRDLDHDPDENHRLRHAPDAQTIFLTVKILNFKNKQKKRGIPQN